MSQVGIALAELRDQVRVLREELARKDAILLRMAESIPQLEAPPEPRESGASTSEKQAGTDAVPPEEQSQEKRPSWWRKLFSG